MDIRSYCEQQGFSDRVVEGGLDYLVAQWEQTVQTVVNGYRLETENYLNDLDGRRIISEVWPLATVEQHQAYQDRLIEADGRFIEATDAVPRCLWGAANEAALGYTPEGEWYYYRVPKIKGPHWRELF